MFSSSRNNSYRQSFNHRAGKSMSSKKQRSFKDIGKVNRLVVQTATQSSPSTQRSPGSQASPPLTSSIVTIAVGPEQRLFAAHENVLCQSPYFVKACEAQFFEAGNKRVELAHEEPEVFSAVLEYLYKGDYSPQLAYDKKRASFCLARGDGEARASLQTQSTIRHQGVDVLKDTAIYCAAHRFSLPRLQGLALRKQGLQSGIQTSTILSSARFAYAHTPIHDSSLRAHYLALIIKNRATFKRSGTMQAEMMAGGSALWFDLFVAMVEHLDDVAGTKSKRG